MNSLELLFLAVMNGLAFLTGYVVADYRRWSKEYAAYRAAVARRRMMHAVERENGPWDNGRVA